MSVYKKIEISVCLGLIISIAFSICSFAKTSDNIRREVLRLHVIANSDSAVDQNLKLRVRNAVLEAGADIFDGSVNVENAVEKITPEISYLEDVAQKTIEESGLNYNVKITIDKEFFTTRTYETVTLPAGDYLALRVVIGSGNGHNWWCVMFPPMCISAADKDEEISQVFNSDEVSLVKSNPKYEPRFKIIEIYQKLKNDITNH
jgi:stage II sporulation protein R